MGLGVRKDDWFQMGKDTVPSRLHHTFRCSIVFSLVLLLFRPVPAVDALVLDLDFFGGERRGGSSREA